MIYLDPDDKLLSIFNINEFNQLNDALNTIAPSMIEYYIDDLIQILEPNTTFNKSLTQDRIYIDKYIIYFDYNDNIYIEFDNYKDDYETQSLW